MADAAALHEEMIETVQKRDLGRLRDLYHPDYEYRDNTGESGGVDVAVGVAETYTTAFPDLVFEIRHAFSTGDVSVVEFTARGTHQAELQGIAPTGKSVSVDVCNVIEVRDGKIYREREYYDALGMMQQLGGIPVDG